MSLATVATAASSVATIISSVTTAIQNGETITTEITEKLTQLGSSFVDLASLVSSGLDTAGESIQTAFENFNNLLGQVTTLLHKAGLMSDETRETVYVEYMAKAEELLKGTSFAETSSDESTDTET